MAPTTRLRKALTQENSSAAPIAFVAAAATLAKLDPPDLADRARKGRLRDLAGVGQTTEAVAMEAIAGQVPSYLAKLDLLALTAAQRAAIEGGNLVNLSPAT